MKKKHGDELKRQFHQRLSRAFTTHLRAKGLDGKTWNIVTHAKAHEFVPGQREPRIVVNTGRLFIEHIAAEAPAGKPAMDIQPDGTWYGFEMQVPHNVTHAKAQEAVESLFAKFGA